MPPSENYIPEYVTTAPIIIDSYHGTILTISLASLAVKAKDTARQLLKQNDLYLAAACLECGSTYISMADLTYDSIEPENLETLDALEDHIQTNTEEIDLLIASTMDSAGPFPLAHDEIFLYAAHQQALMNLEQVKTLRDTLLFKGQVEYDDWAPHLRDAHAATLDYIAHQEHFHHNPSDKYPSRPELNGQANKAREEAIQICKQALEIYQAQIPLVLSPTISKLRNVDPNPEGQRMSPMSAQVGLHVEGTTKEELNAIAIRERDNTPITYDKHGVETHNRPYDLSHALPLGASIIPYTSFIYDGVKYIKALHEPYPQGFPQPLAYEHATNAFKTLSKQESAWDTTIIFIPWCSTLAKTVLTAADLELHDLPPNALASLIKKASFSLGLPKGATVRIVQALVKGHTNVGDLLFQDPSGKWRRTVIRKKALAIIDTARDQGMDDYALVALANAMGYSPDHLHIVNPLPDDPDIADRVQNLAYEAGFPEEAIERIIYFLQR